MKSYVSPPTRKNVHAVVVCYNGCQTIERCVLALRRCVDIVHVVDNGSDDLTLAALKTLNERGKVLTTYLGKNFGVATALNVGVRIARSEAAEWVLTMDQDTIVDENLIVAFCDEYARSGNWLMTPYILPVGADVPRTPTPSIGRPYAITSGNLVASPVYDRCGLYNEALFVDAVDFDFSLRARSIGFSIRRVSGAVIFHQLGEPVHVPRIWRKLYTRHSAARRYYMTRNGLWIARKYAVQFPLFVTKFLVLQAILNILSLKYDASTRQTCRAIAWGLKDFCRDRMGALTHGECSRLVAR